MREDGKSERIRGCIYIIIYVCMLCMQGIYKMNECMYTNNYGVYTSYI